MEKLKNIEYFMSLPYTVTLRKNENLFRLIIPELSIIVEDENLNAAYEKLEAEKERYFQKVSESDISDVIIPGQKQSKNMLTDHVPVLSKILVVSIVFSFFSYVLMGKLSNDIFDGKKDFAESVSAFRTTIMPLLGIPGKAIMKARNVIANKMSDDLFRIRLSGLATKNPQVHFNASVIQENEGNIKGAIEEMELAAGLLSLDSSDKEMMRKFDGRLDMLKKKEGAGN